MPERYSWSPQVAEQVAELPELGSAAFWAAVEDRASSGSPALRPETLVIALRRLQAAGDAAGVQRLATALIHQWEGWVRQRAWRLFPRSADDRADFMSALYAALLNEAQDPAEEFWEANFLHALTCLASDVARPLQRARRILTASDLAWSDDGNGASVLDIPDPGIGPEGAAFVREALGLLDEPERTAVYLCIIEEWPVVDHRGGPSVSRHLGVTDRTVRNYVQRGLTKLRAHYAGPGATP